MSLPPPEPVRSLRNAAVVLIGSFILAAPLGVAMSVAYRALYAAEAWAVGSAYSPEDLEFLQPSKILAAILWTSIVCGAPILATAAALAWRMWRRGSFSYTYAAAVAGVSMAVYMAIIAYVFRDARVALVTRDSAFDGVVYAIIVSLVSTALLRRSGLIKSAARSPGACP